MNSFGFPDVKDVQIEFIIERRCLNQPTVNILNKIQTSPMSVEKLNEIEFFSLGGEETENKTLLAITT